MTQSKKPEENVSKKEFEKLSSTVEALAASMTTFIEKMSNPIAQAPGIEAKEVEPGITIQDTPVDPAKPDKMPIPPAWREIVTETLGDEFGINVVYPTSGAGFLFKISVPKEKSNAGKDYLDFYKVDIRTKSISYSDGISGVRKYCELVAKNLGIKKIKA